MADNHILPFAVTDTGSNLLTQDIYEQDNDRFLGNQPGVARSTLVNKTLRQTSAIAAGVAEFMARHAEAGAADVTDGMTPAEVADYLANVIGSFAATGLPGGGEAGQALVIGENGPVWRFVSGDPIGTIIAFAGKEVPKGFISINTDVETVVPVAAYPQLVETVYCGDEANDEADFFYRSMNADGSVRHQEGGYLVLPAASKYFLRGRDAGGEVDGYRYQPHAFASHTHNQTWTNDAIAAFKTSRFFADTVNDRQGYMDITAASGNGAAATANEYILTTDFTGEAETRPMNFPVMWCIKAWDAPANQGDLDVQALVNAWGEVLNGKADLALSNIDENIDFVIEKWNSDDGHSWYRMYKSGWVEQGGYASIPAAGAFINLLVRLHSTKPYYANGKLIKTSPSITSNYGQENAVHVNIDDDIISQIGLIRRNSNGGGVADTMVWEARGYAV